MLPPVLKKIEDFEKYVAGFNRHFLEKKAIPPSCYAGYVDSIRQMREKVAEFRAAEEEEVLVDECRARITALIDEAERHLKNLKQPSSAKKEKEK